jgi:hypothetical protein
VNRALWLLIGLQLRAWPRFFYRSLATVKGALLAIVGAGVFIPWLAAMLYLPRGPGVPPEQVRLYGPALLLVYCLVNVLLHNGERAVYFTPSEVNFLFTGPFGRRSLLLYKIASTLLIGLPTILVMVAFLRVYAQWLPAALVGLVLMFAFMQLFLMSLNLIATTFGARLFTRSRKVLVGVVVVLGVAMLFQAGLIPPRQSAKDLFGEIANTPAWKAVSLPLSWFFDAFLATRWWPDLAVSSALALGVNLALVGVLMALDANYLEAAAATSARVYARLKRLRRAGLAGDGPGGALVRLSLPALPYWGGIGPNLWRQMIMAMRGMGRLLAVLAIIGVLIVLPLVDAGERVVAELTGILLWLTILLTALVPFDFRGDVDRIALLKTLPIPAWRLAVGQLLTPVLLLSVVHWLVLLVVLPFTPKSASWGLVLAAYPLPFNFLLFAIENLLFLLFPTRLVATSPGDFQAIGRNMLFLLAKVVVLTMVGFAAAIPGGITWALTENLAASLAAAWPVVALSGIALVPFVAMAFKAFDVGRDTPA